MLESDYDESKAKCNDVYKTESEHNRDMYGDMDIAMLCVAHVLGCDDGVKNKLHLKPKHRIPLRDVEGLLTRLKLDASLRKGVEVALMLLKYDHNARASFEQIKDTDWYKGDAKAKRKTPDGVNNARTEKNARKIFLNSLMAK